MWNHYKYHIIILVIIIAILFIGYFGTEEGFTHLTSEGRARLAQFDSMLQAGQGDNHPHVDALNGHFDHSGNYLKQIVLPVFK